ncbi:protein DCL homolog, chloroplastic-like [Impatiens glandulifera]|uniref:protein DCL homolog, chloroplastic-like n=1 Tax=Impatiens glandulifera TaxID=253017 RepID=UPI001FB18224|nr:protein DCL homolog, chloroplastic-like [Impatiens glandulifera]
MAAPLLSRAFPLLRLRLYHHNLDFGTLNLLRRGFSAESTDRTEDATDGGLSKASLSEKDSDCLRWKEKEADILRDIDPITLLAKNILHSTRYSNGERLTTDDESFVVERLLAYHPNSEDKIGCGLDSIMVDRHPQYRHSRCLFVVRTDGGCTDFSYWKCLRAYIRKKYPNYAERFILENLK